MYINLYFSFESVIIIKLYKIGAKMNFRPNQVLQNVNEFSRGMPSASRIGQSFRSTTILN